MGNNKYEGDQTTALPVDYTFYENAANLITASRKLVASTANTVICVTNFEIGRMIVQEEQKGQIENAQSENAANTDLAIQQKVSAEFKLSGSLLNASWEENAKKQPPCFRICFLKQSAITIMMKAITMHFLQESSPVPAMPLHPIMNQEFLIVKDMKPQLTLTLPVLYSFCTNK